LKFRAVPRNDGDVLILDLTGTLSLGEGSATLRNIIRGYIDQGHLKIIANMEGVDHLDSSGIGELVAAYTALKRKSGELKLLKLSKSVDNALLITRLYTVFDIHNDEATAVAAFR
jgi:anti-sigma B factor antagonist